MISQYSIVTLLEDLPDSDVRAGSIAVVLDVYSSPRLAYEIEVVDTDGSTRFLGSVNPEMVKEVEDPDSSSDA